MNRPVIGITMDSHEKPHRYALTAAYATAIERAGGLPFPLAYRTDHSLIPQMVDLLHGVLMTGGDDPDPGRWGEVRHPRTIPLDPAREAFELALLGEIDRRRLPALGICLGCQIMNIHRGGSLIQYLPDSPLHSGIDHQRRNGEVGRHEVELAADSAAAAATGKRRLEANTAHKQAVGALGRGLRIIAKAPDGVVEAIEDDSRPLYLGVQWHPELMIDEPDHLKLFELLTEKARQQLAR